jgi:[ribosomal protein S5]-alanine N-acetyltransferase
LTIDNNRVHFNSRTVYLKRPTPRDADELIALNRASLKLHRGLVSPPTTRDQFNLLLKRSREDAFVQFLIHRTVDDKIVGAINLSQIFFGAFRSAYLGYYIGAPYSRQGYMTEALQLMLEYAFKQLKLHRLEANVQPHNVGSIALIKRAGFVGEGFSPRYLKISGRWRDHERWAILSEDWKANR